MGEKSDQIERHIRETRSDLSENFSELEDKVKTAVDWRAQFEERPGTMIALAFGGGVMLAGLLSSGRSSRSRHAGNRSGSEADRDESQGSSRTSRSSFGHESDQTSQTWNALKGALVGAATAKLARAVEEVLPGFTQEFQSRGGKTSDQRPGQAGSSSYGEPARQKSAVAGAD
jgi:hypothetical protein